MAAIHEFLGIEEDGPVHAYLLLGLDPLESNPRSIAAAVARTRDRLNASLNGEHDREYRKLLSFVDHAEAMLTDPARKRSYDRALAAKLPAPRRPGLRLPGWLQALEPAERVKLAIAAACLAAVAASSVRLLAGPSKFPRPHSGVVMPVEMARHMPVLPPPPATPSVPSLKVGVPQRVPGLEGVGSAESPSMTGDLKAIAFARYVDGGRGHDLFLATREDVRRRFGEPRPVARCNTAAPEVTPGLSPDGLELAFARYGPGPNEGRIYLARRKSHTEDFGEPEAVPLTSLPTAEFRADRPQFFNDGLSLAITAVRPPSRGKEEHLLLVLERTSREGPFEPAVPLGVQNTWATTSLSADGLRAYQVDERGIQVACRAALGVAFGMPGGIQTLACARTGPVVGPFHVAMKEDLLLYCSPGPGQAFGAARGLWMIRIH